MPTGAPPVSRALLESVAGHVFIVTSVLLLGAIVCDSVVWHRFLIRRDTLNGRRRRGPR